jgi:hypothetical protein
VNAEAEACSPVMRVSAILGDLTDCLTVLFSHCFLSPLSLQDPSFLSSRSIRLSALTRAESIKPSLLTSFHPPCIAFIECALRLQTFLCLLVNESSVIVVVFVFRPRSFCLSWHIPLNCPALVVARLILSSCFILTDLFEQLSGFDSAKFL